MFDKAGGEDFTVKRRNSVPENGGHSPADPERCLFYGVHSVCSSPCAAHAFAACSTSFAEIAWTAQATFRTVRLMMTTPFNTIGHLHRQNSAIRIAAILRLMAHNKSKALRLKQTNKS